MKFIRLRICLMSIFIGISGFLMFNELSSHAVYVALSVFFLCASGYAYNNMTDEKEDKINRNETSSWNTSRRGFPVIMICTASGIFFSSVFSQASFLYSVIFLVTVFSYSFFRIKRFLLMKNIYTALCIAVLFLVGSGDVMNFDVMLSYVFFATLLFTGSMMSDIRDYKGDKMSGIMTLPVRMGIKGAEKLSLVLIFLCSVFSLYLGIYTILPVLITASVCLIKGYYSAAHKYGSLSFAFITLWFI